MPNLVNPDNSHDPAGFTSTVDPRMVNPNVLPAASNNVDAAKGYIPCSMKGGKISRHKINKISNKYKMRRTRRTRASRMKRRIRSRFAHSRKHRRHTRRHRQRGGYSQFQNNQPVDMGYSLGTKLPPSLVGMANPPPYTPYNAARDNYNHFNNTSFPSKGH